MTDPIVGAEELTKSFGTKTALDSVTVAARKGDIVGVLGKNGAGKTTLLETLLGFSAPTAGRAMLFGTASMQLGEADKRRIGYVPQRDELVDIMTGRQQLDITAAFRDNWDAALVDRLVAEWEIPLTTRVVKMSVGERQKLSVVQALAHHPELLVLDEPVASLDPIARRRFLRQLLDIADLGDRCVVFSSHIVSDLERAASLLWILRDGRIIWQGALDDLKERVVRLHVRAASPLSIPDLPGLLSSRIDGRSGVLTVGEWSADREARVCALLDAQVEVEPLGLEDIFVEMHG